MTHARPSMRSPTLLNYDLLVCCIVCLNYISVGHGHGMVVCRLELNNKSNVSGSSNLNVSLQSNGIRFSNSPDSKLSPGDRPTLAISSTLTACIPPPLSHRKASFLEMYRKLKDIGVFWSENFVFRMECSHKLFETTPCENGLGIPPASSSFLEL
jgi:hypothetical protein